MQKLMKASDNLKALHSLAEGVSHEAYKCPAGVLTIGIGHTEQKAFPFDNKSKWTDEQINEAWEFDISQAVDEANRRLFTPVSQGVFDATVDLIFNCGTGCRTYLNLVNNRNMDLAADALLQWIHVDGKVSLGLVKRRFADFCLFKGDPSWDKFINCPATSKDIAPLNSLIKQFGYELVPDHTKAFKLVRKE